jgi:hypothetical protein
MHLAKNFKSFIFITGYGLGSDSFFQGMACWRFGPDLLSPLGERVGVRGIDCDKCQQFSLRI